MGNVFAHLANLVPYKAGTGFASGANCSYKCLRIPFGHAIANGYNCGP